MLQTIKDDCRALRAGVPGKRFRHYVDERRARRGAHWTAGRVISLIAGIALFIVGVGIGWLPGPGGFLAFAGLALIAQEIPLIADVLDRIEISLKHMWDAIRRRISKTNSKRP